MSRAHTSAARQSQAAWNTASKQIKAYASLLAASFGGREIIRAADSYTKFNNMLKVAGLNTRQLATAQKELYNIAQANGVELETLGKLFGNAAMTAKELGASQGDLFTLTNATAQGLRITGTSAEQAQGAMLGLSQALASGRVKAEEYNQINEGGLRPLLQAAAANEKFGGSIAKLRSEIVAGNVSSQQFFRYILEGSAQLEAQASNAALTVAQALTVLNNAFTKYIGEASTASGASALLVQAIKSLADNLPQIANALIVIAGLYATSFIPAIARATTAMAAQGAAAVQMAVVTNTATRSMAVGATAMNAMTIAGRGLLTVLGGPLGIALTALTVGIGYYAAETAKANAELAKQASLSADNASQFDTLNKSTSSATGATGELTNAQIIAKNAAFGLKLTVGDLANEHLRAAAAARVHRIEEQKLAEIALGKKFGQKFDNEMNAATKPFSAAAFGGVGATGSIATGGAISTGQTAEQRKTAALKRIAKSKEYQDYQQARRTTAAMIEEKDVNRFSDTPSTMNTAPTGGGAASNSRGRGAGGGARPRDQSDDAMRAAELTYQRALLDNAKTIDEKTAINERILEIEYAGEKAALDRQIAEGQVTKAAGDELQVKLDAVNVERQITLARESLAEKAEEEARLAELRTGLSADQLYEEAERLKDTAARSQNLEQIHSLEYKALEKRQKADRLLFDLSQKQYALDLQKLNLTQAEVDDMLAKRAAIFDAGQSRDSNRQASDQAYENRGVGQRIQDYAAGMGTLNEQLGNIATQGLDNITRGLTDAIMGAKSLKEAFGDMAKAIIADLIQMAVKFVIFSAIGQALGIPGLGKMAIGLGGPKAGTPTVEGNATGTNFFGGGLSMVGEKGPELVSMPRGSQVLPNNLLKSAVSTPSMGANGAPQITVNTTVQANDSVMTDTVRKWVAEGNVKAVQAAQKITTDNLQRSSRNNLYRR